MILLLHALFVILIEIICSNFVGNYLAHTQGKRHQSNLGRRASMEAKNAAPKPLQTKDVVKKRVLKIGRPGYKVS